MSSETEIYNLALNAIGGGDVSSPSEESREAEVCRLWFGPVRDQVLRAAPWPSARGYARLAVLATRSETAVWTTAQPDPTWLYAYGIPADMLAPRNLADWSRFAMSTFGGANALMSNTESAILEYTRSETNVNLWDTQLRFAIAAALASFIAAPLTGKTSKVQQQQQIANNLILQARESQANTDVNSFESIPEWIAARGYTSLAPDTRYFFPNGALFGEGSGL